MKFRHLFAIVVGLIFVVALVILAFEAYVQPLMPDIISEPFLQIIAAIGGAMALLALLEDIIGLAERIRIHKNKYDVYISHSHTDRPFAEFVVSYLNSQGIKAWMTDMHILAGQNMDETLQKAMQQSKSAAFLVGQRGITDWQEKELNWAISNKIRRIPVLLPGILFSAISGYSALRDSFGIQFSSPNDSQALEALARGIKG